jgi:cytochrome P460
VIHRMCLVIALAACSQPVDPEPLGDYTAWKRIDITGDAPGHSNSYRMVYVNPIAADPSASFRLGYPEGSIIVKEIHELVDGAPGDLRYVAIMRRLGPVTRALEAQGGWLFSQSATPNGAEKHSDTCWNRCHVAAPYNGAWYDYRH